MDTQPGIVYVTLDDLLVIREQVEVEAQENYPILNRHGLMSALATPRQAMFGEELFPHLFDKAAVLASLLIKNHPFWDGNKRIALRALKVFLARNGYQLTVATRELERVLIELARGNTDTTALRGWIASHVRESEQG